MTTRRQFLSTLASSAGVLATSPAFTHAAQAAAPAVRAGTLPRNASETTGRHYRPRHRFGLGGVPLAGAFKPTPNADAQGALAAAWAGGVRYFDTSPWYGIGRSERRMGQFLSEQKRDEYILSTKVGRLLKAGNPPDSKVWPEPPPFHRVYDYTADGVRRSIEDSLQRLGVERIDMVFIHDLSPDNRDMGERWTEYFDIALKGAMPELIRMREEGLIKAWGLGVNAIEPALRILKESDPDIFLSATQYTLVRHEDSLNRLQPACAERGVSIVVGSPLNVGFLAGVERIDYLGTITDDLRNRRARLDAIARRHGIDLRTAALQFASAPQTVSAVLVGARTARQIQEDIASMQVKIPADFWAELKKEKLIAEHAPVPA
ncbi:L-fucose dehydrogenase [Cystobacter fuscus DSM 2262]|uniref:L-fucose dehydrogenase n=1 Tax=Cystobacter fuscus (strain ATCC 25194 / DSM 2262 / NBRC 100088 / M29) TaxID=1242864 RepID=S9PG15_CYSF2|nr:aldo/keto reductase [Cystobacter fuscus]EPX63325.1 L-fucose dehydrogenase [Cystobacter fuscus DSM 2262]